MRNDDVLKKFTARLMGERYCNIFFWIFSPRLCVGGRNAKEEVKDFIHIIEGFVPEKTSARLCIGIPFISINFPPLIL